MPTWSRSTRKRTWRISRSGTWAGTRCCESCAPCPEGAQYAGHGQKGAKFSRNGRRCSRIRVDLPAPRGRQAGNDADRFVLVLLRVFPLQGPAAGVTRRRLRVLLVRVVEVPADWVKSLGRCVG